MNKFKRLSAFFAAMLLGVGVSSTVQAAFDSGSTGADGDFNPTVSKTYDLPESGVFNFGTVNIPSGVTVTFRKNSKNTPVTILATGNVTIAGTISVNGSNGSDTTPGTGGPGGFGGGIGSYTNAAGFRGQGPGGGGGGMSYAGGGGGGFGTAGATGSINYNCYGTNSNGTVGSAGSTYGNASLVPLVGGSGGGGGGNTTATGGAGGGGGGAILIASSGIIAVSGSITANGGNGAIYNTVMGGGGSGGSIRLLANKISGEGNISAVGGTSYGPCGSYQGGTGGDGRIRLEAWEIARAASTSPIYVSYLYPVAVSPTTVPSLAITQINGIDVPVLPNGVFKNPDVTLPYNSTGPVTVTVSAMNIPTGKTVTVKALPETGNSTVSNTGTLAGTLENSSAQIQLNTVKGMAYLLSASVNY